MQKWIRLSVFLPAIMFPLAALVIGERNPSIFDAPALIGHSPAFAAVFLISFVVIILLSRRLQTVEENFHGYLLFYLFTAGYFLLGSIFNKPDINTNNIYFAADSGSWYQRMGDVNGWNVGTRAVHPLTYILFRPLIACLSWFTAGDRFHSTVILLAVSGGGCVYLMWKIIKKLSVGEAYPVVFASMLGVSASHLIFASVIESYIFSTFTILLFLWLLLEKKPAFLLIATGITTLGITITNTVQQVISALFILRNARRVFVLFFLVLMFAIGLNYISRFIYPLTEYFFLPQNLSGEQFAQKIDLNRVELLLEDVLIYSIAAPQPYIGIRNGMPRFNFLNDALLNYIWFGWAAFLIWIAFLSFAFYRYFPSLKSATEDGYLSTSLLICLIFNFSLHLGYGIEPFLYSPDWVYALILFMAIALKDLAEQTWFTPALLILVLAISANNFWLLYLIARKVGEYFV